MNNEHYSTILREFFSLKHNRPKFDFEERKKHVRVQNIAFGVPFAIFDLIEKPTAKNKL